MIGKAMTKAFQKLGCRRIDPVPVLDEEHRGRGAGTLGKPAGDRLKKRTALRLAGLGSGRVARQEFGRHGVQRRIPMIGRTRPYDRIGVGFEAMSNELSNQPRLSDSWLADHLDNLELAGFVA